MSKSLQRIILLMVLGIGFGIVAIFLMLRGEGADHVALGMLYLIPSIFAFVALLRLPTKPVE